MRVYRVETEDGWADIGFVPMSNDDTMLSRIENRLMALAEDAGGDPGVTAIVVNAKAYFILCTDLKMDNVTEIAGLPVLILEAGAPDVCFALTPKIAKATILPHVAATSPELEIKDDNDKMH